MTAPKKDTPFTIIRHRGQPTRAQLPDGKWIERQDQLFVPEWGRFIPCVQYDDHFVYEVPPKYIGASFRCTCGAIAVVSGYSAYRDNASQQGLLLLCLNHSTFGVHATGGERWI
jgi:hypothetical protein